MKLDPKVYVDAARLIDSNAAIYTCSAVITVSRSRPEVVRSYPQNVYVVAYRSLFHDFHVDHPASHFWNQSPTPLRQQQRTLALLFMAQVARTGDA